jgi:fermentation-respiration switch protein FrsA (DUF1100 family)
LTVAGGGLLLALLGTAGVAMRVTWKLTHPPRKPVDMDPREFGIRVTEPVTFPSREPGISLGGWYFSASANGWPSNGCTLIFSHGYSQNRQEPHLPALSLAAGLLNAGFDVLMFDFRNAGQSTGALTTIGLKEQEDLLGAIDYVAENKPGQAIGLIGFSMGAATSLLVGGRDDRVRAVVADSPFYSLREYLEENLPKWTGLPRFPFNWVILTFTPVLLRANPSDVKPYEAVKRANKPILFIHGTDDQTVPHENSERLRQLAADAGSALWLVPGAGHVRSYAMYPEEYTNRVVAFFRQALRESEKPLPAR